MQMPKAQSVETPAHGALPKGGQCVSYAFFKVDASFRRLAAKEQTGLKLGLIRTIRDFQPHMLVQPYSLVGLRADVDFLLWQVADEVEAFNALARAMLSTVMGQYLQTPYSLLCPHARGPLDEGHIRRGERGPTLTC